MIPYFLAPFIGWLVSGSCKFMINYIRYGKEAKQRIGNGGFPSTHTTVMTTTVMLIGFQDGFFTPIFGLGVAITYIVIIDATGLRRAVGLQAAALNQLQERKEGQHLHRESMGHTRTEILGGLVLGTILGYLLFLIFPLVFPS